MPNFLNASKLYPDFIRVVFCSFYLRPGRYTIKRFLEPAIYSKVLSKNYLPLFLFLLCHHKICWSFSGALIFETMWVRFFWTAPSSSVFSNMILHGCAGRPKSVIYTDMVQGFILIASCGAVLLISDCAQLAAGMKWIYRFTSSTNRAHHLKRFFYLCALYDTQYLDWNVICANLFGVWYWCNGSISSCSGHYQQRNVSNARKGALFAWFWVLLVFISCIPGGYCLVPFAKRMLDFLTFMLINALPAMNYRFPSRWSSRPRARSRDCCCLM